MEDGSLDEGNKENWLGPDRQQRAFSVRAAVERTFARRLSEASITIGKRDSFQSRLNRTADPAINEGGCNVGSVPGGAVSLSAL